jgi:hypothetical protein
MTCKGHRYRCTQRGAAGEWKVAPPDSRILLWIPISSTSCRHGRDAKDHQATRTHAPAKNEPLLKQVGLCSGTATPYTIHLLILD